MNNVFYNENILDGCVRIMIGRAQQDGMNLNKCIITIPEGNVPKKYESDKLYGIKWEFGDKLDIYEEEKEEN